MNETPVRKGKLMTFIIGDVLAARLKEMSEHYDITNSSLIRELINDKYSEFFKETRGYMAGVQRERQKSDAAVKKELRAERIAFIKTGTPEEISAWLHEVGYFEGIENEITKFIFAVNDQGRRVTRVQYLKEDGSLDYGSDIQTEEELVTQLIKEKKI